MYILGTFTANPACTHRIDLKFSSRRPSPFLSSFKLSALISVVVAIQSPSFAIRFPRRWLSSWSFPFFFVFFSCSNMATPLLMQPLVTLPSAAGLAGTGGGESSGRQQVFCRRGTENFWKSRRNSVKLSCSAESENATSGSTAVELTPPVINLEFLGPEAGGDVATASVGSGEKLLRTIILDNKLELYGLYGKVMNCGGGGSCGTCVVEILEGKELLNERTDVEYKYLKKKPESWRLSCQTIVGDKSNSGKVVVQRLPQKKKV